MYLGLSLPQVFNCREGKIKTLNNYGLMPTNQVNKAYCGKSSANPDTAQCNQYIDTALFEKDFSERCLGKETCSQGINFNDYVADNDKTLPCQNEKAMFYIQYYCIQDDDQLVSKRRQALVVVSISVFIALLYLLAIYYNEKTSILDYKLWDVDTVTVGDFTVETAISRRMWDEFKP